MNLANMEGIDRQVVGSVCRHLSDAGLIQWKPLQGSQEGVIIGMARITGLGVDVIDGKTKSSISISLPKSDAFSGVSAKGSVGTFVPDSQSWDAAAQIAASQRRFGTVGVHEVTTPVPPIDAAPSQFLDVPTRSNGSNEIPAAISITPTIYPAEPANGVIVVQQFITINTNGTEFREFSRRIDQLIETLRQSNQISGEIRDKLVAEINAGMEILKSPKPDPNLIDLLLKHPLVYMADNAAGAIIGASALAALAALGRLTGLF